MFKGFSDKITSFCINREENAYDILAYRNVEIDTFNASLLTNRWHIDSLNQQLKVFLFLKEVKDSDGPLQWIPSTQRSLFKYMQVIKGNYLSPFDLFGENRKYQNIPDEKVQNYLRKGYTTNECTVGKGTAVLIDTSCIHRAKPCFGTRYALCSYYS